MHPKIDAQIYAEKNDKFIENSTTNLLKIDIKINVLIFYEQIKFSEKADCAETTWFIE